MGKSSSSSSSSSSGTASTTDRGNTHSGASASSSKASSTKATTTASSTKTAIPTYDRGNWASGLSASSSIKATTPTLSWALPTSTTSTTTTSQTYDRGNIFSGLSANKGSAITQTYSSSNAGSTTSPTYDRANKYSGLKLTEVTSPTYDRANKYSGLKLTEFTTPTTTEDKDEKVSYEYSKGTNTSGVKPDYTKTKIRTPEITPITTKDGSTFNTTRQADDSETLIRFSNGRTYDTDTKTTGKAYNPTQPSQQYNKQDNALYLTTLGVGAEKDTESGETILPGRTDEKRDVAYSHDFSVNTRDEEGNLITDKISGTSTIGEYYDINFDSYEYLTAGIDNVLKVGTDYTVSATTLPDYRGVKSEAEAGEETVDFYDDKTTYKDDVLTTLTATYYSLSDLLETDTQMPQAYRTILEAKQEQLLDTIDAVNRDKPIITATVQDLLADPECDLYRAIDTLDTMGDNYSAVFSDIYKAYDGKNGDELVSTATTNLVQIENYVFAIRDYAEANADTLSQLTCTTDEGSIPYYDYLMGMTEAYLLNLQSSEMSLQSATAAMDVNVAQVEEANKAVAEAQDALDRALTEKELFKVAPWNKEAVQTEIAEKRMALAEAENYRDTLVFEVKYSDVGQENGTTFDEAFAELESNKSQMTDTEYTNAVAFLTDRQATMENAELTKAVDNLSDEQFEALYDAFTNPTEDNYYLRSWFIKKVGYEYTPTDETNFVALGSDVYSQIETSRSEYEALQAELNTLMAKRGDGATSGGNLTTAELKRLAVLKGSGEGSVAEAKDKYESLESDYQAGLMRYREAQRAAYTDAEKAAIESEQGISFDEYLENQYREGYTEGEVTTDADEVNRQMLSIFRSAKTSKAFETNQSKLDAAKVTSDGTQLRKLASDAADKTTEAKAELDREQNALDAAYNDYISGVVDTTTAMSKNDFAKATVDPDDPNGKTYEALLTDKRLAYDECKTTSDYFESHKYDDIGNTINFENLTYEGQILTADLASDLDEFKDAISFIKSTNNEIEISAENLYAPIIEKLMERGYVAEGDIEGAKKLINYIDGVSDSFLSKPLNMSSRIVSAAYNEDGSLDTENTLYADEVFNYLVATEGLEAGLKYVGSLNTVDILTAKSIANANATQLAIYKNIDNPLTLGTALATPWVTTPLSIIGSAVQNINNTLQLAQTGVIEPTEYNTLAEWCNQTTEQYLAVLDNNPTQILGKDLSFYYNAYTSFVGSTETLLLSQGIGAALGSALGLSEAAIGTFSKTFMDACFFATSMNQTLTEELANGTDPQEALAIAAWSGFSEAFCEEVSVDRLVDAFMKGGGTSVLGILGNFATSIGVEISEEFCTEFINMLGDKLIKGYDSDKQQAIKEYMEQGYSEVEAAELFHEDKKAELKEIALSTALSTGMSQAIALTKSTVQRKGIGQTINAAVNYKGQSGGYQLAEALSADKEYRDALFRTHDSSENFLQKFIGEVKGKIVQGATTYASAEEQKAVETIDTLCNEILSEGSTASDLKTADLYSAMRALGEDYSNRIIAGNINIFGAVSAAQAQQALIGNSLDYDSVADLLVKASIYKNNPNSVVLNELNLSLRPTYKTDKATAYANSENAKRLVEALVFGKSYYTGVSKEENDFTCVPIKETNINALIDELLPSDEQKQIVYDYLIEQNKINQESLEQYKEEFAKTEAAIRSQINSQTATKGFVIPAATEVGGINFGDREVSEKTDLKLLLRIAWYNAQLNTISQRYLAQAHSEALTRSVTERMNRKERWNHALKKVMGKSDNIEEEIKQAHLEDIAASIDEGRVPWSKEYRDDQDWYKIDKDAEPLTRIQYVEQEKVNLESVEGETKKREMLENINYRFDCMLLTASDKIWSSYNGTSAGMIKWDLEKQAPMGEKADTEAQKEAAETVEQAEKTAEQKMAEDMGEEVILDDEPEKKSYKADDLSQGQEEAYEETLIDDDEVAAGVRAIQEQAKKTVKKERKNSTTKASFGDFTLEELEREIAAETNTLNNLIQDINAAKKEIVQMHKDGNFDVAELLEKSELKNWYTEVERLRLSLKELKALRENSSNPNLAHDFSEYQKTEMKDLSELKETRKNIERQLTNAKTKYAEYVKLGAKDFAEDFRRDTIGRLTKELVQLDRTIFEIENGILYEETDGNVRRKNLSGHLRRVSDVDTLWDAANPGNGKAHYKWQAEGFVGVHAKLSDILRKFGANAGNIQSRRVKFDSDIATDEDWAKLTSDEVAFVREAIRGGVQRIIILDSNSALVLDGKKVGGAFKALQNVETKASGEILESYGGVCIIEEYRGDKAASKNRENKIEKASKKKGKSLVVSRVFGKTVAEGIGWLIEGRHELTHNTLTSIADDGVRLSYMTKALQDAFGENVLYYKGILDTYVETYGVIYGDKPNGMILVLEELFADLRVGYDRFGFISSVEKALGNDAARKLEHVLLNAQSTINNFYESTNLEEFAKEYWNNLEENREDFSPLSFDSGMFPYENLVDYTNYKMVQDQIEAAIKESKLSAETKTILSALGLKVNKGLILTEEAAKLVEETGYRPPRSYDEELGAPSQDETSEESAAADLDENWAANGNPFYDDSDELMSINPEDMGEWKKTFDANGGEATVKSAMEAFTDKLIMYEAINNMLMGNYETHPKGAGPIRENVEYRWSFDMDTSCPRTLQFAAIRDVIQAKAGRPLEFKESLNLLNLMKLTGQMVPCLYCYVENKRIAKSREYLNYFRYRDAVMSAKTDAEAIKVMYGRSGKGKLTKGATEVFREWRNDVDNGKAFHPSSEETWTKWNEARNAVFDYLDAESKLADGIDAKKNSAVELAEDVLSHFDMVVNKESNVYKEVLDFAVEWKYDMLSTSGNHIYGMKSDDFKSTLNPEYLNVHHLASNYASSSAAAKSKENYEPYVGNLYNLSAEDVAYVNGMGGIRKHSSNDFRIEYVQDYFLFFADLANKKMMGHTYTKNPLYVKLFGNTGDRINMSIAMDTVDGKVVENRQEGMDWAEARRLQKQYKNAGVMAMTTDTTQLSYALNNDWIEMIIPFHSSGLYKEIWQGLRGWVDATKFQNEKYLNTKDMIGELTSEEGRKLVAEKHPNMDLDGYIKGETPVTRVKRLYTEVFNTEEKLSKDKMLARLNSEEGQKLLEELHPGETVENLIKEETSQAKRVAALYDEVFNIKKVFDKDGKRVRPHFYPYATMKNGETIPGHGNNVEEYFKLCKEYGVHPRFYGMEVQDKDGNTIDATEHENYIKLIKETARIDSEQQPIQFTFDKYDEYLGMTPFDYAYEQLKNLADANADPSIKREITDENPVTTDDPMGIANIFIEEYLGKNRDVGWLPKDAKLNLVIKTVLDGYKEMYPGFSTSLDDNLAGNADNYTTLMEVLNQSYEEAMKSGDKKRAENILNWVAKKFNVGVDKLKTYKPNGELNSLNERVEDLLDEPGAKLSADFESTLSEEQLQLFNTNRENAIEKYGTTDDIRDAGFIFPDGTLLDLKRNSEKPIAHGYIGSVIGMDPSVLASDEFQKQGNIRISMKDPIRGDAFSNSQTGIVQLWEDVVPTEEQYSRLAEFINTCLNELGYCRVNSYEYTAQQYKGASDDEILAPIKRFFATGSFVRSSIAEFHSMYSADDMGISEAQREEIIQAFADANPIDAKFSADVDADVNALPLAKSLIYFAGGGTLENGLKGLLDTRVAVEMQPGLAAIYRLNHGDKVYLGKVQDFEKTELDSLKGIIEYFHASPVCCNYSPLKRGNKYAYKEDSPLDKKTAQATANTIEKLLPRVFTLENVPGYEKSEAVQIVIKALEDNGYVFKKGTFNASDYGAPTTRKRWLLWAVRGEDDILDAPVATTPTNKTSWDQVVDFDSLEDGELQNFMRKRLEAPEMLEKFDYRHPGKKILILYGTQGKAGENVAWYPEGVPCGTLRTKNDGRIILEDGTVKLIDPETFKQLQGLSTYVLPPNNSRQKSNSYRVVGNGIPPQLTRAVFGPVIEKYIIDEKNKNTASDTRYSADELSLTYDILTEGQKKTVAKNAANADVGSTLFNLKYPNPTSIKRATKVKWVNPDGEITNKDIPVGKDIGGQIYAHISYINQIVPPNELKLAYAAMDKAFPAAKYNCFNYTYQGKHKIAFQEVPNFDTEREPIVGQVYNVTISSDGKSAEAVLGKNSPQIFHHKWLWVDNDYSGFDVAKSWEWSKKYLSTITGTFDYTLLSGKPATIHKDNPIYSPDGSCIDNWNRQLEAYGLPLDTDAKYSVDETLAADALEKLKQNYREDIGFRLPLDSGFYYAFNPTYTDAYGNKLFVEATSDAWSPSTYIDDNGERRILTQNTYATAVKRNVGGEWVTGCPLFGKYTAEQLKVLEKDNKAIERNSKKGNDNTQNPSTRTTYEKLFNYFDTQLSPEEKKNFRVLDASSGLGLGTQVGREKGFNVVDLEPFPVPGYEPMYTRYKDLQFDIANGKQEAFDLVISNAVINVCPQDERDEVVAALGTFAKENGKIFINTLTKDYPIKNSGGSVVTVPVQKTTGIEGFVLNTHTVQKGYSANELKAYVSDVLRQTNHGEWDVVTVPTNWNVSGGTKIIATKLKDGGVISRFADPAKYSVDDISYELEQSVIDSLTENSSRQLYSYDEDTGAARWTEETLDAHIKDHRYGENKSDSWLTWMTPRDYLNLTVSKKEWADRLRQEVDEHYGELDLDKLTRNEQLGVGIELFVDTEAPYLLKEVIGHEGRHRAILLEKAGVTKMPVRIIDRETRYDEKTPYASMWLSAQDFYGESSGEEVRLGKLIPITEHYREELMDEFVRGGNEDTVRYSLDTDSMGAALTQDQITFFANSKVRDEDGRLLRVYHGSPNEFTIFNGKGNSSFGEYKFGDYNVNYFTSSKETAKGFSRKQDYTYGKTYSGYVNIVNPYEFKDENTNDYGFSSASGLKNRSLREFQINLFDRIYDDFAYADSLEELNAMLLPFNARVKDFGEDELYRYELFAGGGNFVLSQENFIDSGNDFNDLFSDRELIRSEVLGISEEYGDDDYYFSTDEIVNLVIAMNEYDDADYDGIIIDNIFDSTSLMGEVAKDIITIKSANQFKETDNQHPTSNEDMRYSLDEINYEHPEVTFGMSFSDPTGVLLERIFNGEKTYETRNWTDSRTHGKIPGAYLNKLMGIVRNSDATGKAKLVGYWQLGEPELWDFNNLTDDQKKRLPALGLEGTNFADAPNGKKWVYPIEYVEELKTPREVNANHQGGARLEARPEQIDSAYLKAIENNDLETAQAIIDNLAKKNGYVERVFHGTDNGDFNVFKQNIRGTYTTTDNDVAGTYGKKVMKLYGKKGMKVLTVDAHNSAHFSIPADYIPLDFSGYPLLRGKSVYGTNDITTIANREGYDMVVINNVYDNFSSLVASNTDGLATDIVYFNSNMLKSAEPITYDNNGEIIPPSERFNTKEDDIRYSIDAEESFDPEKFKQELIPFNPNTVNAFVQEFILQGDVKGAQRVLNDIVNKYTEQNRKETTRDKDGHVVIPRAAGTSIDINKEHNQAEIDKLLKDFGALPGGENPKNKDFVAPNRRSKDMKTSRSYRTINEAYDYEPFNDASTTEYLVENIGAYTPVANKKDMTYADNRMKNEGFAKLYDEWNAVMSSGSRITSKHVAIAAKLIAEASSLEQLHPNQGYLNCMLKVAADLEVIAPEYGQVIQAFRMIKKTTPAGVLYYANNVVKRLNKMYEKEINLKKTQNEIVIKPEIAEMIARATSKEELDRAIELFKQSIADQIKPTLMDKWNAWRYLAMLGNPKTHIRNFIGNVGFVPLVMTKNLIAASAEAGAEKLGLIPKELRSKTWRPYKSISQSTKNYCMAYYDEIAEMITGGGRRDIYYEILDRRNVWGDNFFGKILSKYEDINANGFIEKSPVLGLEAGDAFFLRQYFIQAMASFIDARGLDMADITEENQKLIRDTVQEAARYAILEAQKATYRDASAVANALNGLRKNKVVGVFIDGVMPFTKTPINIFKRGVLEYSPIGLLKGAGKAWYDNHIGDQQALIKDIDDMAAGMTGSMIAVLGYFLAQAGLLRGGGSGDDKEDDEMDLIGHQDYSVIVGDGKASYTIGWLAPLSIPLFLGVQLYESLAKGGRILSWESISTLCKIAEPILSLSMLDGINDLFTAMKNADDLERFFIAAFSVTTGYITQGLTPSLISQLANATDTVQRRSYVDKNSSAPSVVQKWWQNSILGKFPGLNQLKTPYVDNWGRVEDKGGLARRVFDSFFNPGYFSYINDTEVDQELRRLAESLGRTDVLPGSVGMDIALEDSTLLLDAEQFTQLALSKGQTSYALIAEIINSSEYQKLEDGEKETVILNAYKFATDEAKHELVPEYEKYSWIDDALKVGAADYIIMKSQLDDNPTNNFLFEMAVTNPELDYDQQAALINSAFSSPAYVDSEAREGYRYKLTDSDWERLEEIRTELFIPAYLEMVQSEDWESYSVDDKVEKVDSLYNDVLSESKVSLSKEIDKTGREAVLGNPSSTQNNVKDPIVMQNALAEYDNAKDISTYLAKKFSSPKYLDDPTNSGSSIALTSDQSMALDKLKYQNLEEAVDKAIKSGLLTADNRDYQLWDIFEKVEATTESDFAQDVSEGIYGDYDSVISPKDQATYATMGTGLVKQYQLGASNDEQIDYILEKFTPTDSSKTNGVSYDWSRAKQAVQLSTYEDILRNGSGKYRSWADEIKYLATLSSEKQEAEFDNYHDGIRAIAKDAAEKAYPNVTKK